MGYSNYILGLNMVSVICPNCKSNIQVKSYKAVVKGKSQCSNCHKILAFEKESFLYSITTPAIPFVCIVFVIFLVIYFNDNNGVVFISATIFCVIAIYLFDKVMERFQLKHRLKIKE